MSNRIHVGTLLWGAILTIAGALLTAIGFGWWEITTFDLRYMGPALVVLIGIVILISATAQGVRDRSASGPNS
ncbi:MAG TPA: hypothetical protein VMM14_06555 [Acidimicrobiia bacterium]|nr:hypothetical protein [Acidimicrobiia bacterium]